MAGSGLILATVSQISPPPEFRMSGVTLRLCPAGTEPKSRFVVESALVGASIAVPTAVCGSQSGPERTRSPINSSAQSREVVRPPGRQVLLNRDGRALGEVVAGMPRIVRRPEGVGHAGCEDAGGRIADPRDLTPARTDRDTGAALEDEQAHRWPEMERAAQVLPVPGGNLSTA